MSYGKAFRGVVGWVCPIGYTPPQQRCSLNECNAQMWSEMYGKCAAAQAATNDGNINLDIGRLCPGSCWLEVRFIPVSPASSQAHNSSWRFDRSLGELSPPDNDSRNQADHKSHQYQSQNVHAAR